MRPLFAVPNAAFVSCSAFLIEAPADEADEFLKRCAEFRVHLRKFVAAPVLTEERFGWLVFAVDKAWAEIIPEPKALLILRFLRAQFLLEGQDDPLEDYLIAI